MSGPHFKKVETENNPMIIDIIMPNSNVSILTIYDLINSELSKENIINQLNITEEQYSKAEQYIDTHTKTVETVREQREIYLEEFK